MRCFIMALAMLVACIIRGIGWPQQKALAAATLNTTSTHKIVNENSRCILDMASPSLTTGSMALQWSNNGTAGHLWQFTSVGSVYDVIPQSLICLFL